MEPIQVLGLLTPYFQEKLAVSLHRRVNANPDDVHPHARQYSAEILAVDGNDVYVHLTAISIARSGCPMDGSETDLGDWVLNVGNMRGLDQFWKALLALASPMQAIVLEPRGNAGGSQ